MDEKHFLNELWYFITSKGLEEELYNTLSKTDREELKDYLKVGEWKIIKSIWWKIWERLTKE